MWRIWILPLMSEDCSGDADILELDGVRMMIEVDISHLTICESINSRSWQEDMYEYVERTAHTLPL